MTDISAADSPWIMAGVIAYCLLWTATYVLVIIKGFREKTYGIPMMNICLNFSWEFIFSFVYPDPNPVRTWLYRFWFIPDILILYQLIRYGRENQSIPEIRENFNLAWISTLVLSFLFIYLFVEFYGDTTGTEVAFLINAWMSIGFVFMYFFRRDRRGLSLPAAWTKMLGTAIASVVVHEAYTIIRPDKKPWGLLELTFLTIFIFDVLYIALLSRPPKPEPISATGVTVHG